MTWSKPAMHIPCSVHPQLMLTRRRGVVVDSVANGMYGPVDSGMCMK